VLAVILVANFLDWFCESLEIAFPEWCSHVMANTKTTVPDLITQEQVAARLGVSHFTVRDWRKVNAGPPYVRVGGSIRYWPADVEAWLESRRVAPSA
jgi:predicted DNA-binding transcriptional regulator AlpA